VKSKKLGDKGVPCVNLHDGRTIRYPDPNIKVGRTNRSRNKPFHTNRSTQTVPRQPFPRQPFPLVQAAAST
jgi:transposase